MKTIKITYIMKTLPKLELLFFLPRSWIVKKKTPRRILVSESSAQNIGCAIVLEVMFLEKELLWKNIFPHFVFYTMKRQAFIYSLGTSFDEHHLWQFFLLLETYAKSSNWGNMLQARNHYSRQSSILGGNEKPSFVTKCDGLDDKVLWTQKQMCKAADMA